MITTIVLIFYSPASQVVNCLAHLLHLFYLAIFSPSATRVKSQLCRSPPRNSRALISGLESQFMTIYTDFRGHLIPP
jgi:hypothetical protein